MNRELRVTLNTNSKTVIITGGNSGLGYQSAENIAEYDKNYYIIMHPGIRKNLKINSMLKQIQTKVQ